MSVVRIMATDEAKIMKLIIAPQVKNAAKVVPGTAMIMEMGMATVMVTVTDKVMVRVTVMAGIK